MPRLIRIAAAVSLRISQYESVVRKFFMYPCPYLRIPDQILILIDSIAVNYQVKVQCKSGMML
jgi:hypothetical protein